ncbi:hypothetical protein [Sphingomonas sp. LHG3406-1]|uniref:hypothetical protein n=1 Tax=Sphingomonas sp. LHG3406-1 TaxID=2804617 RepID=UPI002637699F|nr:hypothetical protein [Sphingomonas sp. LHG3406-1]
MTLAPGSYATLVGTVPTFEAGWNTGDRRGLDVTGNGPEWVRGRHFASLVTFNAGHRRYLISFADPETADASYQFDVILLPDGAKGMGVLRHVGPYVSGQDPVRTSRLVATSYCDSDWTAAKGIRKQ